MSVTSCLACLPEGEKERKKKDIEGLRSTELDKQKVPWIQPTEYTLSYLIVVAQMAFRPLSMSFSQESASMPLTGSGF